MDIYCVNCENACSGKAKACPKCGHPLQESTVDDTAVYVEIGMVRIIGTVLMCVGVFLGIIALVRNVPVVAYAIDLMLCGFGLRCLAGVWGTLERIARK